MHYNVARVHQTLKTPLSHIAELAELFNIGRSTIYRAIERDRIPNDARPELVAERVRARRRP